MRVISINAFEIRESLGVKGRREGFLRLDPASAGLTGEFVISPSEMMKGGGRVERVEGKIPGRIWCSATAATLSAQRFGIG